MRQKSQNSTSYKDMKKPRNTGVSRLWRRRRDSNSRNAFDVYAISSRTRSTNYATSPCIIIQFLCDFQSYLHDFQSCALDQLSHPSVYYSHYITYDYLLQVFFLLLFYILTDCKFFAFICPSRSVYPYKRE